MHSRQYPVGSRQKRCGGGGSLPTAYRLLPTHSAAFTLTEVLIVIGIIVLVLAMAVPAFNYITGARSIASAENLVSAMLARARNIAIQEQRQAGVIFFYNPNTRRSTMSIVLQRPSDEPITEDPYHNYKGWTLGVPYNVGHEVIARVLHPTAGPPATPGGPPTPKWVVMRFVCIQAHPASGPGNGPPNPAFWDVAEDQYVDFIEGDEFQVLPPGVGLQLINDPKGFPQMDRYVRTGAILFNEQGQLISREYTIRQNSLIGQVLGLSGDLPTMYSQLGLVLYEREQLINRDFASENDWVFRGLIPGMTDPQNWANEEEAEEEWLDENTTPLLVNRYNGTLIKGE